MSESNPRRWSGLLSKGPFLSILRTLPVLALLLGPTLACGPVASQADPSGGRTSTPPLLPEPDAGGGRWVEETLASLSLREAAGQLIIPWMSGAYMSTTGPEFQEFARYVEEAGIGGVVISIGLPHTYGAKLNALQERAKIPLLVSSDFENGGPGMRINHSYALPTLLPQGGGTSFPPTMAFGAIGEERFAFEYGRVTAAEARAVGVHLNFAPVLDVNSNPLNPIINTRSFGEDPEAVANLGAAYLAGAREGGVLTTAKHFPGHGDTKTDSHVELPIVDADRDRLEALELVPFRRAVEEGVDAVMTAHVAVPGVLGPDGPPATLSPYFLTELLREDMGFDGLILTDAIRMQAIAQGYGIGESAVLALEAGADIILAPADIWITLDAVEEAVRSGRITRARLDASVRRVLELKARVGLHRNRRVNLDAIGEVVGSAEHLALAETAATRSITLPRDQDGLIPVDPARYSRVLHVVYARGEDLTAGRALGGALGSYFPRVSTRRLSADSPPTAYQELAWLRGQADLVVVSAFVAPRAGAGEVAVPRPFSDFVAESVSRRPTVVLSLGNPYLLSAFPQAGTYLLAWGPHEVSQRAAVRALVGESAISGRLPISLPPFHGVGEGLTRDRVPYVPRLGAESGQELEVGVFQRAQAGALPGAAGSEEGVISVLEVDPSTVGMDSVGLAAVDSLIRAALADSASPGAALAVGRHGKLVRLRGYGRLDWTPESPPATPASLWDMASVTKVSATTTAAMILVEAGRLDLDAPVVRYIPWWSAGDPRKNEVTVRHLLLHRAGLPPFRRFFMEMEGKEAFQSAIADLPLDYVPGDSTVYSDIGLMTVAFVVEELTGTTLDAFLRDRVWGPLGMQDTDFRPDSSLLSRIAPTEVDTTYRHTHVHGVVHDENAFAMGGVAGHAGLFSSARDMAVLAQALLNGGAVGPCTGVAATGTPCSLPRQGPIRVAAPTSVELFTRRHDETSSRALGWDTPTRRSSGGDYLTDRAFGHTGFTGTSIWVDPELDLFVILLTSRTNPTRANSRHTPLRRAVHDAVVQAITDVEVVRRRPLGGEGGDAGVRGGPSEPNHRGPMMLQSREKIWTDLREDHDSLAREIAKRMATVIRDRNSLGAHAVLGLATGSTPIGVYRELIRLHRDEGLSFSRVVTFNLDEYYPMDPESHNSYVRYMWENLFGSLDIPPENVHIPDGTVPRAELEEYCSGYDQAIRNAGGIDFLLLGLGRSGHIGFNEPGTSRDSWTHLVFLDSITRADAASDFFGEENVPLEAITMGVASILDAKEIALLATGEHKAPIVKRAVEGEVHPDVAATYLQSHPNATVYLDKAAGADLTRVATPWLLGEVEWTPQRETDAVIWLSQQVGRSVLRLSTKDYRDNHLSSLVARYGSADPLNGQVFNRLIAKIRGKSKLPEGKRVLVFSPHPDDDVISMGGILRKLVENENQITVAYQTSGNIAVFDHDVRRYLDFLERGQAVLGGGAEALLGKTGEIRKALTRKGPGEVDIPDVQALKRVIREAEAVSALEAVGLDASGAHFLNLPFYQTGQVRKDPISEADVKILSQLLEELSPEIVFAAGDLSDPHGTHRMCLEAVRQALEGYSGPAPEVWLYRGAWQEWPVAEASVLVPLSEGELRRKIMAIFKHQSQKDKAPFPGADEREFWQRTEARNRGTADLLVRLGLPAYYGMEAYVVEREGERIENPPAPTATLGGGMMGTRTPVTACEAWAGVKGLRLVGSRGTGGGTP